MRIAVIGAGSWGTTLANLLASKGRTVTLWVYEKDLCPVMRRERVNALYLPGVPLERDVHPTPHLAEAAEGAHLFVTACPSQTVRSVTSELAPFLPPRPFFVSVSKGLENGTLLTCSQVLGEVLPAALDARLAVLSGPSFAREVSQGLPTLVVAASTEKDVAHQVQHIFSTPTFRVYTNGDVVGVELGGALKNVMAIAAGISDGLNFGHNARAALLTRGLAEITRLGMAMGAIPQTFSGLAGLGDLLLTCTDDQSRNRTVGLKLGRGEKLPEILEGMTAVAEGVKTVRAAVALGERHGVELPISRAVYAVLYEGKKPMDAVTDLMNRSAKPEFEVPCQ